MCKKIKSNGNGNGRSRGFRLKPVYRVRRWCHRVYAVCFLVGPALAGKGPVQALGISVWVLSSAVFRQELACWQNGISCPDESDADVIFAFSA